MLVKGKLFPADRSTFRRSNIGNGRLYGLEEDLGLKGDQFQTATSVFFATYVVSNSTVLSRLLLY